MKKALIILSSFFLMIVACNKDIPGTSSTGTSSGCGTYNGKTLYKGSEGGCYYINSSGNKTYVDRSKCKC